MIIIFSKYECAEKYDVTESCGVVKPYSISKICQTLHDEQSRFQSYHF